MYLRTLKFLESSLPTLDIQVFSKRFFTILEKKTVIKFWEFFFFCMKTFLMTTETSYQFAKDFTSNEPQGRKKRQVWLSSSSNRAAAAFLEDFEALLDSF